MKTYAERKEQAREKAIEWQERFFSGENPPALSWGELADWQEYFTKQGRKYGLIREFRENAII